MSFLELCGPRTVDSTCSMMVEIVIFRLSLNAVDFVSSVRLISISSWSLVAGMVPQMASKVEAPLSAYSVAFRRRS